ncbi:hypothetical protein GEMRC1_010666 [Eukaryota sp. GEM-RC1]
MVQLNNLVGSILPSSDDWCDIEEVKKAMLWVNFSILFTFFSISESNDTNHWSEKVISNSYPGQILVTITIITQSIQNLLPKTKKKPKVLQDCFEVFFQILKYLSSFDTSVIDSHSSLVIVTSEIIGVINQCFTIAGGVLKPEVSPRVHSNDVMTPNQSRIAWKTSLFISFLPHLSFQSLFSPNTKNNLFQTPAIRSWSFKAIYQSLENSTSDPFSTEFSQFLLKFLDDESASVRVTAVSYLSNLIDKHLSNCANSDRADWETLLNTYLTKLSNLADDESVSVRTKILNIWKNSIQSANATNKTFLSFLLSSFSKFLSDSEDSVRDSAILCAHELFYSKLDSLDSMVVSSFINADIVLQAQNACTTTSSFLFQKRLAVLYLAVQLGSDLSFLKECCPECLLNFSQDSELKSNDLNLLHSFYFLIDVCVANCLYLKQNKTGVDVSLANYLKILKVFSDFLPHVLYSRVPDELLTFVIDPKYCESNSTSSSIIVSGLDLAANVLRFLLPARPTPSTSSELIKTGIYLALQAKLSHSSVISTVAQVVSLLTNSLPELLKTKTLAHLKLFIQKLIQICFPKGVPDCDPFQSVTSSTELDTNNFRIFQLCQYGIEVPHRLLVAVTAFVLNFEQFSSSNEFVSVIWACHFRVFQILLNFLTCQSPNHSVVQMAGLVLPSFPLFIQRFPIFSSWYSKYFKFFRLSSSSSKDHIAICIMIITSVVKSLTDGSFNDESHSSESANNSACVLASDFFPNIKQFLMVDFKNELTFEILQLWSGCMTFLTILTEHGLFPPTELAFVICLLVFSPFQVESHNPSFLNFSAFSSLFDGCEGIRSSALFLLQVLLTRFEALAFPSILSALNYIITTNSETIFSNDNQCQNFFFNQLSCLFNLIKSKKQLVNCFLLEIFKIADHSSDIDDDSRKLNIMEFVSKILISLPYSSQEQVLYISTKLSTSQVSQLNLLEKLENLVFSRTEETVELVTKKLNTDEIFAHKDVDLAVRWHILVNTIRNCLLFVYDISSDKLESFTNGTSRSTTQPILEFDQSKMTKALKSIDEIVGIDLGDYESLYQLFSNEEAFVGKFFMSKTERKKGQKSSKNQRKKKQKNQFDD